jgi:hypothetical protein
VPLRGADGVAADALRGGALAAATLDRAVDAQHGRPGRREGGDQEAGQQAGRRAGGPGEHATPVGEPPLPAEPRDP